MIAVAYLLKPLQTLLWSACVLALPVTAMAQPVSQLSGVVRDTTGSALPGVTVTITGAALVAPRTFVTNEQGRYELDALPAGRYVVSASLSGFETRTGEVDIEAVPATLDLSLDVSSFSDRVTVTATKTGAADVQTTPIAVTALPGRTLEQLGIQTVEGLAGFVPTLIVSQQTGAAQVTIRGIGTNSTARRRPELHRPPRRRLPRTPRDGRCRAHERGTRRGPAGAARNALRAQLGRRHDQHRHQAADQRARSERPAHRRQPREAPRRRRRQRPSDQEQGDGQLRVSPKLARGLRERCRSSRPPARQRGTWAGRGQLRIVLGTRSELLLSGDYGRFDGVPLTYAKPIAAKRELRGSVSTAPPACGRCAPATWRPGKNTQQGASARLTIPLNATTTLNSLTAYRKSNYRFFIDADATELTLQTSDVPDLQHQFSQELTIVQRTPKVTWIGGVFLFEDHNEGQVEITVLSIAIQIRPFAKIGTKAGALFGQASVQPVEPRVADGREPVHGRAEGSRQHRWRVPARHG